LAAAAELSPHHWHQWPDPLPPPPLCLPTCHFRLVWRSSAWLAANRWVWVVTAGWLTHTSRSHSGAAPSGVGACRQPASTPLTRLRLTGFPLPLALPQVVVMDGGFDRYTELFSGTDGLVEQGGPADA
jgi:hypothetical protein